MLLPASCSLRSDSSEGSSLGERGRGRWASVARSPREMSVHMTSWKRGSVAAEREPDDTEPFSSTTSDSPHLCRHQREY
ncbi:hypothetical protein EYF80_018477 [Liparis tanakae]|uniref:Uncharacterized protein n=1 Tax=Liparis tanakae TaxID=230148 RepID=A0A4Z2I123_9TELE|nr:hypothetical protein EYF80_018477 [Liparis tanakae]